MKKRVMILGAGANQVPLIKKARDEGHYVITVDYLPNNIGHRYSHHFVNCSTTDKGCVAVEAQKLNIDAICTAASDVAVPTVAHIAWLLELPGPSLQAAHAMSDKTQFRMFQWKNNLNSPKFFFNRNFEELWPCLQSLSMPLMFKPSDSSGSRGVTRVENQDYNECVKAFNTAQNAARNNVVCIEEFIPGTEVGGDGFMVQGKLEICVVTQKFVRRFIPVGHRLPASISITDQLRVKNEIETICKLLEYNNGPVNFDVMVNQNRIAVIEMGARSGGNGISSLVKYSTGFDMHKATLHNALGIPVDTSVIKGTVRGCGSMIFGSDQQGIIEKMASFKELKMKVPEVFDTIFSCCCGDTVSPFVHSGNQIGAILFKCTSEVDYLTICRNVEHALGIQVLQSPLNDQDMVTGTLYEHNSCIR